MVGQDQSIHGGTEVIKLFYELLQVSVGNKVCLSQTPSADEWGVLYAIAKKQSLVGVCFAGIRKLVLQEQAPEKVLYLTWLGMAAKIQQRNEMVNRQCAQLGDRLKSEGYSYCVLKGQGVASLYKCDGLNGSNGSDLSALRQSGDIDVWIKGGFDVVCDYVQKTAPNLELAYHRFHYNAFPDTEVELHHHPSLMNNPIHNARLQKWLDSFGKEQFVELKELGFMVPPSEMNKVFLLCHLYRHFVAEGVGMRQLMDYYFVLKNSDTAENERVMQVVENLGMKRFARAVMWVIAHVFANDTSTSLSTSAANDNWLLCEPDRQEGEYLLNEVMMGGNFGKHDERYDHQGKYAMQKQNIRHSCHLLLHYPSEVLWTPAWLVWHFFWKKKKVRQIKQKYGVEK